MIDEAHAAVADFLGAGSPGRDQVRLQHVDPDPPHRALHRGDARPGDEIVVTTLDHEANV